MRLDFIRNVGAGYRSLAQASCLRSWFTGLEDDCRSLDTVCDGKKGGRYTDWRPREASLPGGNCTAFYLDRKTRTSSTWQRRLIRTTQQSGGLQVEDRPGPSPPEIRGALSGGTQATSCSCLHYRWLRAWTRFSRSMTFPPRASSGGASPSTKSLSDNVAMWFDRPVLSEGLPRWIRGPPRSPESYRTGSAGRTLRRACQSAHHERKIRSP